MRDDHQVLIITNQGILIRVSVDGISVLKRITSGVKIMNTGSDENVIVAGMTKVLSSAFKDETNEQEGSEEDINNLTDMQNDNLSDAQTAKNEEE